MHDRPARPRRVLDGERVRGKAPTYTVFNGRYNGFVDKPLPAKPGERVRLLVLNSIAGGDKLGPDLYDVTKRRDDAWLTKWLKSPEQMLAADATAKQLLDKYKLPMPNPVGLATEFEGAEVMLEET